MNFYFFAPYTYMQQLIQMTLKVDKIKTRNLKFLFACSVQVVAKHGHVPDQNFDSLEYLHFHSQYH